MDTKLRFMFKSTQIYFLRYEPINAQDDFENLSSQAINGIQVKKRDMHESLISKSYKAMHDFIKISRVSKLMQM